MSDSETVLNSIVSSFKIPGKSKFKHFLYDLGLRNALAVTFYSLCLYSSLMVPATTFVAVLLFVVAVSPSTHHSASMSSISTTYAFYTRLTSSRAM